MSQTTDELLSATLALPAPDRKKIAELLTASLPAGEQPPTNGAGSTAEEPKVNRMALITLANWKPESPLPPPPNSPKYQWPADVWDFAVRHQVAGYLDPIMEATRRNFPIAESVGVLLRGDPEIPEEWQIVFDVRLRGLRFPGPDLDRILALQKSYAKDKFAICPAPLLGVFNLRLDFAA